MTLTPCRVGATLVLAWGPAHIVRPSAPLGSTEVLHNIENEGGLGKNTGNLGIQTDIAWIGNLS